jgi:hypothetical protein
MAGYDITMIYIATPGSSHPSKPGSPGELKIRPQR